MQSIVFVKHQEGILEYTYEEFEKALRQGLISSTVLVRSDLFTDNKWIAISSLELFKDLYHSDSINYRIWFRINRFPWLTFSLILLLIAIYYLWGPAHERTVPQMVKLGAKAVPIMTEIGQWWRLLVANFLHASPKHLWFDIFFLFNLGGIAENIYRRTDLALVYFYSGILAMVLSTIFSPLVSVGSSGMLFGAWGAVAVFAVKHRDIIPDFYRRLFTWNLIPYAVILLFSGLASPSVDNFAHIGGLISGILIALFLVPKLLNRSKPRLLHVISLMAVSITVLFLLGLGQARVPLVEYRLSRLGIQFDVPRYWDLTHKSISYENEELVFDNNVGVALSISSNRGNKRVTLQQVEKEFMSATIAPLLGLTHTANFRITDSYACPVDRYQALCLHSEWYANGGEMVRIEHLLLVRGYYQYIVSFRAPDFLFRAYWSVWDKIKHSLIITDPDLLQQYRQQWQKTGEELDGIKLAYELIYIGQIDQAIALMKGMLEEKGRTPMVAYEFSKLLLHLKQNQDYGLRLARFAVKQFGPKVPYILLLLKYLALTEQWSTAQQYVRQALKINANHSELIAWQEQISVALMRKSRRFTLP